MDVHAKDGAYPTAGRDLGHEYALGTGCVDFPALIKGLKAHGYGGALTIEREISGEEQVRDILSAKAYLEALI
jgi:sugar phosphate isomerase/epimerase